MEPESLVAWGERAPKPPRRAVQAQKVEIAQGRGCMEPEWFVAWGERAPKPQRRAVQAKELEVAQGGAALTGNRRCLTRVRRGSVSPVRRRAKLFRDNAGKGFM